MVDAEENTNTKALILSSQVGLNIGKLELYLKEKFTCYYNLCCHAGS